MRIKTDPIKWNDFVNGIDIDVEIPNSERHKLQGKGIKNTFLDVVTIYNDIPADNVNPRRFDRTVIDKCNIMRGRTASSDGTVTNDLHAITVISKDVDDYVSPLEYKDLPADLKEKKFTLSIGDFVVLESVDDIVTTSREFAELQQKYKDIGFSVRSVGINIYGLAVDNVQFANVG